MIYIIIILILLILLLTQMEKNIMATFEELKAQMEQNNLAIESANVFAADANVKLDAVNIKIDELRDLVNNGNPVSQVQLDELAVLANIATTSMISVSENLAGIAADVADAEQS